MAGQTNDAGAGDMEVDEEEDEFEEGGIRIGDIYLPPPPPPSCTFDNDGPRLIITHIENENFKSYLGRQVLGPFHKNFTSIVGPNGSGKSNVIDSMLFVFGYRAQKIRSKKISVLIHNSEGNQDVNSCKVAVHFQKIIDKGDDIEVVPNSGFVVSRTAFKDNSSFYQVDGKRAQFKQVAKLLRGHGVDLDHNRFLILQGEVEQIALMKPKALSEHETGMLEFLEDIIGSSRYKEPIELLSKRVEDLGEQRGEKLNRVKLVEKEKDELEGPKNEALGYLRVENDITRKKNVMYQRYILDCSRSLEKAESKKKEIDEGLKEIKEKLAELGGRKKEKEGEMKKLGQQLDKLSKEKEENTVKFKAFETEDVELQENLKHNNSKRKKLMQTIKTDKSKLEELQKIPEKNEADIEELTVRKGKLEAQRTVEEESVNKVMAGLREETKGLQEEKDKYETQLIDLRKNVNDTRSKLDIAQSELDIYLSNDQAERSRLVQIETNYGRATATVKEKTRELETLLKKIPVTEEKLKRAQRELQETAEKEVQVLEDLKKDRARLEDARSSMQAGKNRGRVLEGLMEQKANGNLPGVYGRLGDLGAISEKYDVAISTACGPLDNIVVDTVDTAQKCINFLKKHRLGMATFIALDKMEKWRQNAESTISTPENVPRLYDLIKINDPRIKTAFYFALRDTLVADTLEQATRIAYGRQRHRVVTLKGDLIETVGTMSGGGKRMLRGRMGKCVVPESFMSAQELAKVESSVDELTKAAATLRRTKSELEYSVQQLTKEVRTLTQSRDKCQMEAKEAEEQMASLKTQMAAQEAKVKEVAPDKKKVQQLEKVVAQHKEEFDAASAAAGTVESQVDKVHKKIVEVGSGRVKSAQKKLDEVTKQLDKAVAEITRLGVAIKTAKRNMKKTEEKLKNGEQEVEETEKELKEMYERRKKIEEGATEVLDKLKKIESDRLDLDQQLSDIKEQLDEVAKAEVKIKAQKIEVDQEIDKFDGIIKENKAKVSHWKKQLSKLKLQELPLSDQKDKQQNLRERKDGEEMEEGEGEVEGEEEGELRTLTEEQLEALNLETLQYELTVKESELQKLKPNMAAIEEYKKKEEVYLQRVGELDEITAQRDEQRKHHDNMRKQRLNEFMSGFTVLTSKLKEMYQMITLGGDAELELVDSLDPFSEGIVFSVRPPKKSWKNITNLSGGEKTLSSLALVFALHYYKPTPLYVMDEIDAALDFKNVSIVGNYIKERTKNAQFIIISLRSQMFELADRLVGIYKTYNATKSVTINPYLIAKS